MRKRSTITFATLFSLCIIFLFVGPKGAPSAKVEEPQSASQCSDLPTECKPPVKFLGQSNRCACFSCEYGKKTQKIRCTSKAKDKQMFMILESKSSPQRARR